MASPVGAAAAWGVRKGLAAAYRKRTGKRPPRVGESHSSLGHALLWSVISAAALALVDVLVSHLFRHAETERSDAAQQPRQADEGPTS